MTKRRLKREERKSQGTLTPNTRTKRKARPAKGGACQQVQSRASERPLSWEHFSPSFASCFFPQSIPPSCCSQQTDQPSTTISRYLSPYFRLTLFLSCRKTIQKPKESQVPSSYTATLPITYTFFFIFRSKFCIPRRTPPLTIRCQIDCPSDAQKYKTLS